MAIGVPRLGAAVSKSSGSTTLAVPYPIGASAPVAGDYMVIMLGMNITTLAAVPSGWDDVYTRGPGGTAPLLRIYSRRAVGGETGSVSCAIGGISSTPVQGRMVVLSDVDTATPLDVSVQAFEATTAAVTISVPSFDVVTAAATLLGVALQASATGTWNPPVNPAPWTELHDAAPLTPKMEIAYLAGVTPGATGTLGFTSTGSAKGIAAVLALRPTVVASTSRAKRWTGTAWADAPVQRWTGSAYVPATVKRWDGAAWV
jgi:hypothetical protein